MKNVQKKPDEFLKAQTFFSITKLIPGHCLKTQKHNMKLYVQKIKILLLNLYSHPHLFYSTSFSRSIIYNLVYILLEFFKLYISYISYKDFTLFYMKAISKQFLSQKKKKKRCFGRPQKSSHPNN